MSRLNKKNIAIGFQVVVIFLNAFLLVKLSGQFLTSWTNAETYLGSTYGRVDHWLASAQCARTTGVLLAICSKDGFRPIEDVSLADDPGHALIMGILGKFTDVDLNRVTLIRANLVLNAVGMMGLVVIFAYGRLFVVSGVFLAWSSGVVFSQFVTADVFGAYFGIVSLAMMLASWIGVSVYRCATRRVFWTGAFISMCLLLVASAIRQPLGIVGSFSALVLVPAMMRFCWNDKSKLVRMGVAAILVMAAVVPLRSSDLLVKGRELAFGVPPGQLSHHHGISHNLYLGLGSQPNPWDIRWDDGIADRAVKAVRPDVKYVSDEYFDVLWQLYFDRVLEYPDTVLRIYVLNAAEILSNRLPSKLPSRLPEFTVQNAMLTLGFGMLMLSTMGLVDRSFFARRIGWLLLVMLGASAMILVQGVITMPYLMFYFPAALLLAVAIGLVLQGLIELFPRQDFKRYSQRLGRVQPARGMA